ncbi:hypothetical protein CCACVL1_04181 [Corchorus capsularis]|uniref:F-box domain-containing protein n=1 Tax=Corchorus capsularis TaxID=210143 RepID=A0A1R3JUK8_COCAP|nr:hypothetical protein CCACVL1_04181 [Corchorus capsularis]
MKKNDLSQNSILDILSRLPVKSLRRFGCVSKRWRSLIVDPLFRKLHHDRSQRSPLLMFYNRLPEEISDDDDSGDEFLYCGLEPEVGERPISTHSLKAEDESGHVCAEFAMQFDGHGEVSLIPSYRELVCLKKRDLTLFVCNPSTHELLKLPNPSPAWLPNRESFELRYVPSVSHYKLLHVYYTAYEEFGPAVAVADFLDIKFDEKPNGWKCACEGFPGWFKWLSMKSVQGTDAAVYWYNMPDPNVRRDNVDESIACFDLEKEESFTVEKPLGFSKSWGPCTNLVGLKGCLSLIDVVKDSAILTMDIWMLKDNRNSVWEKEFTINMSAVGIKYILPMHFGERVIIFNVAFASTGSRVRYYDLVTKTWRTGGILPRGKHIGPFPYFDGLFSLAG